jgi:YVTN family beta-propeller protein
VAVNSVTNQIYVANQTSNTVTVIDGATNDTSTVNVDLNPAWLAVNPVTNQIYVANFGSNTVTVIDGATLNTASVTVGNAPSMVVVDPVTNKIYVANYADGTMTMIDGATNNTTTIAVGNSPGAIEANVVTNKVYVPNQGDNTVSVILGASAAPLQFVAVTPCRLIDTRLTGGPIPGGTSESFPIPQEGGCNIPTTAAAYSLNVSVVPSGQLGYLTIWPTGEDQPLVATLNSLDGRIKADAAIVPAGYQGAITIYVTNTTNVVLDINGYFAPVSGSTLAFYPLTPCRIADTRKTNFPPGLGAPFLPGHTERDFPILAATTCNIPSSGVAAYSLNFSVVPHGGLGYMTVWPTGQPRPLVSTLNDVPGTIIANAAIVPAGTSGDVSVYPSNDTDVIIDINGYFAPAGMGGLSLYPVAPCRVIDTRKLGPPFSGNLTPPVDVANSACQPPAAALAYVFNATVVPTGALGYLTLWPDGEPKPLVSTLNALDGSITNNMAIVPSTNGKVDAFASGITQLILDISSYFAP